jgi:hypothetical protein
MRDQDTTSGAEIQPSLDPRREVERRYLHLPPIQWSEFAALMRQGVPAPALIWPDYPARALVVFRTDQPLFDFAADLPVDLDDEPISAMVFLALDEAGSPIDLVAWATKPYRIASWFGATPFLGAESLLAPRLGQVGLKVFPDPLSWLKAERDGVVIVHPEDAKWRIVGERLIVSDGAFGRELREKLSLPQPRIAIEEAAA